MEVKGRLTTIICPEELEEDITKFLKHHELHTDGKIYAQIHREGEICIHTDLGNEIFEITGPGGSKYIQGTQRWQRLQIDDMCYFIEFYPNK